MIEQAKQVSKQIRNNERYRDHVAADTIDALVAEVEDQRYKQDYWKRMHDELKAATISESQALRAEVERLKQEQAEPVAFLANGTRFKTSEYPYGVCINGLPKELSGRWVALVAAEDDCHLKLTAPQGQTALLRQALEALEEATHYTSTPAWSPSMTRDCEIVVAAIKQHLGEA